MSRKMIETMILHQKFNKCSGGSIIFSILSSAVTVNLPPPGGLHYEFVISHSYKC